MTDCQKKRGGGRRDQPARNIILVEKVMRGEWCSVCLFFLKSRNRHFPQMRRVGVEGKGKLRFPKEKS